MMCFVPNNNKYLLLKKRSNNSATDTRKTANNVSCVCSHEIIQDAVAKTIVVVSSSEKISDVLKNRKRQYENY